MNSARIKLLVLIISFTCVFALIPARVVLADPIDGSEEPTIVDSGICGDDLIWTLDEEWTLTISGTGDMYEWIGATAWADYTYQVQSVVVTDGVTSISAWSFYNFSDLSSANISDSVSQIGDYAFYGCSNLSNLSLPGSLTSIGEYAFGSCESITKIVIPSSITTIEDYAFSDCLNLEFVYIYGEALIGEHAFENCSNLVSLVMDKGSSNEYVFSGIDSNKVHYFYDVAYESTIHGTISGDTRTYGTDVIEITAIPDDCYVLDKIIWSDGNSIVELSADTNGNYLVPDSSGSVTISATFVLEPNIVSSGTCGDNLTWFLDDEGILIISGSGAMYNFDLSEYVNEFESRDSIRTVIISEGVTKIGNYAFCDCVNLTNISIPNSVVSIGTSAFKGCISLEGITLPNSITQIGFTAFRGCSSLTNVTLSESLNTIYTGVFYECESLESIVIPYGVQSISNSAFEGCKNLNSISIPESVYSIGFSAFRNCSKLSQIELPDSVDYIGDSAFEGCTALTSVEIPSSVTSIGDYAFYGCTALTSIEISNSLETLNEGVFCNCSSLASIEIPDSVICIKRYAFRNCTSLSNIILQSNEIEIEYYAFEFCDTIKSVVLNKNTVFTYDECPFNSNIMHYFYDVSYAESDHGSITGITRTYGTDVVEFYFVPDESYEVNQVIWTDGDKTIVLRSDSNGMYTMPDSETSVSISAVFTKGGACGDSLTWSMGDDGILKITGSGDMYDWEESELVPWYDYRDLIESVIVSENATSIGDNAFVCCSNLNSVVLDVNAYNQRAFSGVSSIDFHYYYDIFVNIFGLINQNFDLQNFDLSR